MPKPVGPQASLVMERTFDSPVAVIWPMWTDPEHFKGWYGPTGATIPVARMDLREGGERFVGMEMETPNGTMQRLGPVKWKNLQRLSYLLLALVSAHVVGIQYQENRDQRHMALTVLVIAGVWVIQAAGALRWAGLKRRSEQLR